MSEFTGEIYKDYRFDGNPLHFKVSDEALYKQFIEEHFVLYQKFKALLMEAHKEKTDVTTP